MKNIRKLILVLLATGVVCTSSAIAGYVTVKKIELSSILYNTTPVLDLQINAAIARYWPGKTGQEGSAPLSTVIRASEYCPPSYRL